MSPKRHAVRALCVAGAALIIAGCGGGDDMAADPGMSPAPAVDPNAATVGDGAAPVDPAAGGDPALGGGETDPVTGLPVDGGAIGGTDIAETIPKLEGGNVSGGLAAVGGGALFQPAAVKGDELADEQDDSETTDDAAKDEAVEKKPAVRFSGARMYVDGVTHEVKLNGTFPKGDPVFRLVSVDANTVEVELIAGEFTTNGGNGVFLDKGELVSVLNQSEQLDYRVKYLRPVTSSNDFGFN